MDPHNLKKINVARKNRQAVILLTEISSDSGGRDRVIYQSDTLAGEMGDAVTQAFKSGNSGVTIINGAEFFLNVYLPRLRIVIVGAVHIAQSLAVMATQADFDVEIIDPRSAFATEKRFEGANVLATNLFAKWPQEVFDDKPLDKYSALVAVSHDPKIDDVALMSAIKAECIYIGALGSKKSHAKRVERLLKSGLSSVQISKIHAPIGLDIGAANPAEISIAIIAQIVDVIRNAKS